MLLVGSITLKGKHEIGTSILVKSRLSYLRHTYPTAKKSNFLDFINAQSKIMHHTTWLTASRNLHSNTHGHLTTRTHGPSPLFHCQ